MSSITTSALEQNLSLVRERIEKAAIRSGRSMEDVTLVAVTKTFDRLVVDAAYDLGVRFFGENRVQEAKTKFANPLPKDAELHMIGNLQSNKAGAAIDLFDCIQSVDRESLIRELGRQAERRGVVQRVLLEVNVAGEEQKAGCDPAQAESLLRIISESHHLDVGGVMTMAPLTDDVECVRPVFRSLRELRDRLQESQPNLELHIISMGMTNDFEVAIEEGATHVRIGRAIFRP
jgi:PLP dependent protein